MYLLEVIPLSRGIQKETLTYFSKQRVTVGTLVEVPLRKKEIKAIVIGISVAAEEKISLKGAAFALKKATSKGSKESEMAFSPAFVAAAKKAAAYFATSTGAAIFQLVPKVLLENPIPSSFKYRSAPEIGTLPVKTLQEPLLLQADDEERFGHYKSLVREAFARNESVYFCVPTQERITRTLESLEKGIRAYTYALHASLSKKEILNRCEKALKEKHPILIVGTGLFLSLPRPDIKTIILDRENSGVYKLQTKPYIDIRIFAEYFAHEQGARFIVGDVFLRVETLYKKDQGRAHEFRSLTWRPLTRATTRLIDMKSRKEGTKGDGAVLFSEELNTLLRRTREENEHMFLFTARRGLAPTTLCSDCGTSVLCSVCSAPLILHRGVGEVFYLCHRCGKREGAERLCAHCGGWRLTTLGIGIERVEKTLAEQFPDLRVWKIDGDSVKSHSRAQEIYSRFENAPAGVLLGTEMAVAYLNKKVESSAVVSLDSLLALPDWRVNEKIFNLLLRLRSYTEKEFLLQTRSEATDILEWALKGNVLEFYRNELVLRKQWLYPPYSKLIKISVFGKPEAVRNEAKKIGEFLAPWQPHLYPSPLKKEKGKEKINLLIRLPEGVLVDQELSLKLTSLPPYVLVMVDPENLL